MIVLNRFELIAPYDHDGVLRRWLAQNLEPETGERVLVSVAGLPPGIAASARVQQLAAYETAIARQIHQKGVVPMIASGLDNERLFFASALPVGVSWKTLWRAVDVNGDRIPVSLSVHIAAAAAELLHRAHTQVGRDGMTLHAVHGAVAPDRLYLTPNGDVALADFGLGRVMQLVNAVTDGAAAEFVRSYRSPEQVQQKAVGTSTDVFLLGVVLWEMLTMTQLYPDTMPKRDIAIVTEPPDAPSNLNAAVTGTLDQVVLRALSKQPSDRYSTAEAQCDALRPFETSMPMHGSVSDYLDEVFGATLGQWQELNEALDAGDLHGALVASRGTVLDTDGT